MKKVIVILAAVVLMISINLLAQDFKNIKEIKDTKDYPLVSSFQDSKLIFNKKIKWDTYKLPVYKDNTKEPNYKSPLLLEGKVERWQYVTTPDNNPAYVMKNFESAFKKSRYKILLEGKQGDDFEEGPTSFCGDYYNS